MQRHTRWRASGRGAGCSAGETEAGHAEWQTPTRSDAFVQHGMAIDCCEECVKDVDAIPSWGTALGLGEVYEVEYGSHEHA